MSIDKNSLEAWYLRLGLYVKPDGNLTSPYVTAANMYAFLSKCKKHMVFAPLLNTSCQKLNGN